MTARVLLRVGRPRMALYAVGRSTTRKEVITVFAFGKVPRVRGRVMTPSDEIEAPVNPVSVEHTGFRFSFTRPSFWKAS